MKRGFRPGTARDCRRAELVQRSASIGEATHGNEVRASVGYAVEVPRRIAKDALNRTAAVASSGEVVQHRLGPTLSPRRRNQMKDNARARAAGKCCGAKERSITARSQPARRK